MNGMQQNSDVPPIPPYPGRRFGLCPTVMTEDELIQFLRIPEISRAKNHRHATENLKRVHGLPRIHLCGKTLYLTDSAKAWLQQRVTCGT